MERQGQVEGALLMVSDITRQMESRRVELAQREQLKIFEHVLRDRMGFVLFFKETRSLLEDIFEDAFPSQEDRLRAIHTLKGNCAIFELNGIAQIAHRLEEGITDNEPELASNELAKLGETWDELARNVETLLGEELGDRVELTQAELDAFIANVRGGASHARIEHALLSLRHEPLRARLARIGHQVTALSQRMNKGAPQIAIEASDLRLPIAPYAPFWSTFAHIVRNVVDHGFQTIDERRSAGKPESNRLKLAVKVESDRWVLEVADDGNGIDWSKIAAKAGQAGLLHATQADLIRALFQGGVSTAERVTDQSGRGVGLSAVFEACQALGGTIAVESKRGQGTLFRFTLPLPRLVWVSSPAPSRLSLAPISRASASSSPSNR